MAAVDALTWITLVSDAETPEAALPYAGRVVGVRPEDATALGSGPGSPGWLYGVRGYLRTAAAGGTLEWLMTAAVDSATRTWLANLPGGLGWVDATARSRYATLFRTLLDAGITNTDVRAALAVAYTNAVANERATKTAGG
jgi:hypothetical protein